VTDSDGTAGAINLRASGAETVGDVLDLLNGLGIGIEARVNDSGDGILLVDTAGGNGELTVSNEGGGNAATDLRIARDATTIDVDATPTQVIDGSTAIRVTLDDDDTLQDLVDRINEQSPDVAAGIFSSGGGTKPFRLTLASQISGVKGALVVDASSLGASFQESVAAQDALLLVGSADSAAGAALASSATNDFADLLNGVTLHVNGASTEPVTVTVDKTVDPIVSQVKLFVSQYNALQDKLDELTFFDAEANSKGILFGSGAALRIESNLANLVTSRYRGFGSVQSLEELGIGVNDKGRLEFNEMEFRDAYAENSEDVQSLFTTPDTGITAKFNTIAEQLAGVSNSTLIGQSSALQIKIDNNSARVRDLNESLEREREALLLQFYRLEETISRLQASQSAIAQIQPISLFSGS
jgi:flagellar hook-associated protein 2